MRRKLVAAFAITLSILMLTGAAVGSSNRPIGSGQDGTFTFAPLRIGDQGEYSMTIIDDAGTVIAPAEPLWELAWLEQDAVLDFEGRERDVVKALSGWTARQNGELQSGGQVWGVEPGTWDLVYSSQLKEGTVEIVGDQRQEQYYEQRSYINDELFVLPCPIQNRYAGQTVDLADSLVPFVHCSWHDHWAEEVRLKAMHRGAYGEDPSVTFRSGVGNLYQATFVPSISFPVELVVEIQDATDLFYVIRLESFTPGVEPFPESGRAPGASQFTELDYATWDRYPFGVFDQRYPIDEAMDDAMAHPDASDVQTWMESHPEWYVARGHSSQHIDHREANVTETSDWWHFTVHDGTSGYEFSIARSVREPAPIDEADPLTLLDEAEEPTTSFAISNMAPSDPAYLIPSRDTLPDELPVPASLVHRWELLSGREGATHISFRTGCVIACDDWFYGLSVGIDLHEQNADGFEWTRSSFETSERPRTGPGNVYRDSLWRTSPAALDGVVATTDPVVVAPTGTWNAPTEQAAFTVGSIGLLGGALALVWPTIRNLGLVRLFSRIQGDRLLEHPQRQRIMEVVYAEPGIHVRALRERLDLGSGVADHHVRKMEQSGLLQVDRRGNYACLFPQGHMDHSAMAAVPLMKGDGAKSIVEILSRGPALQADLASRTGLSKGTLSYHLKRLADVGAVEFTKEGRSRRITLTELGTKAASSTVAA